MAAVVAVLISIAGAFLGAFIWAMVLKIDRIHTERSGKLAGTWWQITYYGDDPKMEKIPWSVEVLKIRHAHETISGTMWRAHGPHFERVWSFLGRSDDGHVDSLYWAAPNTDGGKGSLQLWQVGNNNLRGSFVESKIVQGGDGLSIDYMQAPLEWIRVGSSEEQRALRWLDPAEAPKMAEHAPKWLVSLFEERMAGQGADGARPSGNRKKLSEGFYGGPMIDLTGPLALETERLRRIDLEAGSETPGQTLVPEPTARPLQGEDDR